MKHLGLTLSPQSALQRKIVKIFMSDVCGRILKAIVQSEPCDLNNQTIRRPMGLQHVSLLLYHGSADDVPIIGASAEVQYL